MVKRRDKVTQDSTQGMLLPPSINEYDGQNNSIKAIDAYVGGWDLINTVINIQKSFRNLPIQQNKISYSERYFRCS